VSRKPASKAARAWLGEECGTELIRSGRKDRPPVTREDAVVG
jgi:hypothetical protein